MKDYVVCVIAKNEESYIREFVEYHLSLGFDRIILGDNDDISGGYNNILSDLIEQGKVTIVPLNGKKAYQKQFYNSVISDNNYEWCAFIDVDEFITFNQESGYNNIKNFLQSKPDIKAYKLNWMVYGDNNEVYWKEGNVVDRFKEPKPIDFRYTYIFSENAHVKSIINKDVKNYFINHAHTTTYNNYYSPSGNKVDNTAFNHNIDYDIVYIRHYYTKTLEEWMKFKYHRGNVNVLMDDNITYTLDNFFQYNRKTPEKIRYLQEKGYIK